MMMTMVVLDHGGPPGALALLAVRVLFIWGVWDMYVVSGCSQIQLQQQQQKPNLLSAGSVELELRHSTSDATSHRTYQQPNSAQKQAATIY